VWLDPKNAKAFVQHFCDYLCKIDPENAEQYQQNQRILLEKLSALEQKLKQLLPKKITYICFHDAYAYFDHAFGTECLAIVTNNPEHPSLNPLELQKLHHLSRQEHIKIFTEPQFEGYSLKRLTEQQAFLDPYGIHTSAEQEGYFQMMEEIAISLSQQRET
jgi:zinc transport system substrate-binding protein